MAVSMQNLLKNQRILLIQGKMGNFFSRFSSFLQKQGITVSKIHLNAGDAFFYRHRQHVFAYQNTLEKFDSFLIDVIERQQIQAVVCFGDCRPHHMIASVVCKQLNIGFFVFEEGYLRPDYITFQQDGINGNSQLDLTNISKNLKSHQKPLRTYNRFWRLCISAIIYYIIIYFNQKKFPHYQHYRGMDNWQELLTWLKAPLLKIKYYFREKMVERHCTTWLSQRYFLVSLQVYNDSQITFHSDYADNIVFIEEILGSFAKFADKSHHLVFKHHPLDIAHRDYTDLIKQLSQNLGIFDRVHYCCDTHLPTLIKHSLGMVTINSTTGLQSIFHGKPTKVMGRAIYNVKKLTVQDSLDDFWQNPIVPNREFYWQFRSYLIEQTQLNGSFYGLSPWRDGHTGDKG